MLLLGIRHLILMGNKVPTNKGVVKKMEKQYGVNLYAFISQFIQHGYLCFITPSV